MEARGPPRRTLRHKSTHPAGFPIPTTRRLLTATRTWRQAGRSLPCRGCADRCDPRRRHSSMPWAFEAVEYRPLVESFEYVSPATGSLQWGGSAGYRHRRRRTAPSSPGGLSTSSACCMETRPRRRTLCAMPLFLRRSAGTSDASDTATAAPQVRSAGHLSKTKTFLEDEGDHRGHSSEGQTDKQKNPDRPKLLHSQAPTRRSALCLGGGDPRYSWRTQGAQGAITSEAADISSGGEDNADGTG